MGWFDSGIVGLKGNVDGKKMKIDKCEVILYLLLT